MTAQTHTDIATTDWSGRAGRLWAAAQDTVRRVLKPLNAVLLEAAGPTAREHVLDVGCGAGDTTFAFARRAAAVDGVDVSAELIAAARRQGADLGSPARFIEADAQTHQFKAGAYDLVTSRFGVMFFEDPAAAFANLGRAMRGGGRFIGLVWRSAEDNPFMTAAEHAAAPLLPDLTPRVKDAPGQFGFADPDRVAAIFAEAGWRRPEFRAVDVPCDMPSDALATYAAHLGPVGRKLPDLSERKRAQVMEAVLPAFDPYVTGDRVRFNAACWLIVARG